MAGPYAIRAVYPQAALLGVSNTKPRTLSAKEILVTSNFCAVNPDLECVLSLTPQSSGESTILGDFAFPSTESATTQEPKSLERGLDATPPSGLPKSCDFVAERLLPSLRPWVSSATHSQAQQFHDSVLNMRLVVVPSIPWVRAYEAALGDSAIFYPVFVSPMWTTFTDAWDGGLAHVWFLAKEQEAVILVCLDQVDRSPSSLWYEPLLRSSEQGIPLPNGVIWPQNLRVLCTLADDAFAFPVDAAIDQLRPDHSLTFE